MITEFIQIFSRDLDKLTSEISEFREENDLWQTTGSIKNSAGNLCLHLVGNLRTYIGKNLGSDSYVRDREAEFTLMNIPKEKLLQQVEEAKRIVKATLGQMQEEALTETYPENVLGQEMTTGFFLMHLSAHLSYHLGQINYLRRALKQ
ncbi:DUF1572 domain-containing protein [Nibribacter ruber]|uniref:DUF1572 domain-containing protein n=1 Tax=Nibribacter ruber TaxID=2698458 RepID=A0A6P1NXF8_9BACT|nr:DinB family protein [Nibribacter ruber]QHL86879.1 DUF1572 domain-containing protein [Nibribacter ruber]